MTTLRIITIIQLASAVFLTASILLQQRGSGLSGTFGGEGSTFSTRRGIEKFLFVSTIVLAIVFVGVSIVRITL